MPVLYECDGCGKTWKNKYDFNKHKQRKYPCNAKNIKNNDEQHKMNDISDTDDTNLLEKIEDILVHNKNLEESLKQLNNKTYEMEIEFHKQTNEFNKKTHELEKEIIKIKKSAPKTQFNNCADKMINFNLHLNAFGKENVKLTDSELSKIIDKGFDGIKNYVNLIHFNENKPENHNIYVKSLTSGEKFVMVFNGMDWEMNKKNDAIERLKVKGINFISGQMTELEEAGKLTKKTKAKVERVMNKYYDEDKEWNKQVNEDIELILFNKSKMVKNTINTISQLESNKCNTTLT